MIAMALSCVVLAQAPIASDPPRPGGDLARAAATGCAGAAGSASGWRWPDAGAGAAEEPRRAASSEAVAVRGDAELSPAEAFASARRLAEAELEERWRDRGHRLLVDQRPFWLPALLAEHALQGWLAARSVADGLRIVDREDRVREHEFGRSYQTTLWVAEDARAVAGGERSLRRELGRVAERTLVASGGTVLFWAVLALLLSWFDRLSRGYMTGRLLALGLALGTAVPAIAFLL